jgi:hypothetical protein
VRIYRRRAGEFVDLIEHPESGRNAPFHNLEELSALLLDDTGPASDAAEPILSPDSAGERPSDSVRRKPSLNRARTRAAWMKPRQRTLDNRPKPLLGSPGRRHR